MSENSKRIMAAAVVLTALAASVKAENSLCQTTTTVHLPAATRILQAVSTCAPSGGGLVTTDKPYTTIYQTTYLEFCPTGLQPKTYTVTESCSAGQATTRPTDYVPQGFTTTVTECHVCGSTPITATLTVPCTKCQGSGEGQATTSPGSNAHESGSSQDSGHTAADHGTTSSNGATTSDQHGAANDQGSGQVAASESNGQSGSAHSQGSASDGGSTCHDSSCTHPAGSHTAASAISHEGGTAGPSPASTKGAGSGSGSDQSQASSTQPLCAGSGCQGTSSTTAQPGRYTGAASAIGSDAGALVSLLAALVTFFSSILGLL